MLDNLAGIFSILSKYEKAESLFNQSLEIRKRIFGLEHPDTASTLNNIGLLYESLGKYEDAEPLLKQSLDAKKEMKVLKKSLPSFDTLSRQKPGPTTSPEQVTKFKNMTREAKVPEDFVISSGNTMSVRQFTKIVFKKLGIELLFINGISYYLNI